MTPFPAGRSAPLWPALAAGVAGPGLEGDGLNTPGRGGPEGSGTAHSRRWASSSKRAVVTGAPGSCACAPAAERGDGRSGAGASAGADRARAGLGADCGPASIALSAGPPSAAVECGGARRPADRVMVSDCSAVVGEKCWRAGISSTRACRKMAAASHHAKRAWSRCIARDREVGVAALDMTGKARVSASAYPLCRARIKIALSERAIMRDRFVIRSDKEKT
jgi:hypothetical protein